MTPEEIAAVYRERNGTSAVALGDMMLACRREHRLSQQELARRMKITPGVVHHHESVALLPEPYRGYADSGKLTFKESRSLADLGFARGQYFRPDERMHEIVALFTSGRLSSVYVEPIVRIAKAHQAATVDDLVTIMFSKAKTIPKAHRPPAMRERPAIASETLRAHILGLAGEVEAWGMGEHCEVERMPVVAAARLLTDRLARVVFKTGGVRAPVGAAALGEGTR